MHEPWTPFLKLGIVHFMAFPQTQTDESQLLPSLERLAFDPFFQAIEVKSIQDPAIRREAKALLGASQMTVGYGAQPLILGQKLNLNAADKSERQRAIDALRGAIDDAADFGATAFALMSGPDPGPNDRETGKKLLVESLVAICKHAAEHRLPVALEVFDREIDKRALIGSTEDAVAVARSVREACPNFGLMLDLSHLPLQGESTAQALPPAREFLVHAHIGNCIMRDASHVAYGDHHPRFGVPGGENDIPQLTAFLDGLFDIGFLRPGHPSPPIVSFEVKPLPGESPEVVIANAKRSFIAAWSAMRSR